MQTVMDSLTRFYATFREQGVIGKLVSMLVILFVSCCLCSIPLALLNPSKSASEVAKTPFATQIDDMPAETPILTSTATITIPTATFTLTSSPTPSSTLTPLPFTQTANALNLTATKKAENATSTSQAKSDYATQTTQAKMLLATEKAAAATATKELAEAWATGTAQVKSATATAIAQYEPISAKELVTYPDNHIGDLVVIKGKVFNVISNTDFQIWIDGGNLDGVYISMTDSYSDIYEGDRITIYGIVLGQACGTNAFGGQVCMPQIMGVSYEKK